jgi:hypothetical protein
MKNANNLKFKWQWMDEIDYTHLKENSHRNIALKLLPRW